MRERDDGERGSSVPSVSHPRKRVWLRMQRDLLEGTPGFRRAAAAAMAALALVWTGACVGRSAPSAAAGSSRTGAPEPKGAGEAPANLARPDPANPLRDLRESHLRRVRQLTFGGENAEAYFDASGRRLIFQSTREGGACDQIYTMATDGRGVQRVSTGRGRCTCSYWFPDGKRILYSSTHLSSEACPPAPDRSKGYVWALYDAYEIVSADPDGGHLVRLTDHPGYDAEATLAEDGSRIVFTSLRDGDVDLYTMAPDGTDTRRVTREAGYDGGAFFSPDGKRFVYRASRPRSDRELEDWTELLSARVVRPTALEIYVAGIDGSGAKAITSLGAASFAPCWLRDGRRILFASNTADPKGRDFDLYLVGDDGSGLERVTFSESFDGFPIFSRDGGSLVFASNRNGDRPGETNIFIADWVP